MSRRDRLIQYKQDLASDRYSRGQPANYSQDPHQSYGAYAAPTPDYYTVGHQHQQPQQASPASQGIVLPYTQPGYGYAVANAPSSSSQQQHPLMPGYAEPQPQSSVFSSHTPSYYANTVNNSTSLQYNSQSGYSSSGSLNNLPPTPSQQSYPPVESNTYGSHSTSVYDGQDGGYKSATAGSSHNAYGGGMSAFNAYGGESTLAYASNDRSTYTSYNSDNRGAYESNDPDSFSLPEQNNSSTPDNTYHPPSTGRLSNPSFDQYHQALAPPPAEVQFRAPALGPAIPGYNNSIIADPSHSLAQNSIANKPPPIHHYSTTGQPLPQSTPSAPSARIEPNESGEVFEGWMFEKRNRNGCEEWPKSYYILDNSQGGVLLLFAFSPLEGSNATPIDCIWTRRGKAQATANQATAPCRNCFIFEDRKGVSHVFDVESEELRTSWLVSLESLGVKLGSDETVEDFVKTMLTPWNVERSTSSERDEEKKRLCAREREKEMKEKLQREMKRMEEERLERIRAEDQERYELEKRELEERNMREERKRALQQLKEQEEEVERERRELEKKRQQIEQERLEREKLMEDLAAERRALEGMKRQAEQAQIEAQRALERARTDSMSQIQQAGQPRDSLAIAEQQLEQQRLWERQRREEEEKVRRQQEELQRQKRDEEEKLRRELETKEREMIQLRQQRKEEEERMQALIRKKDEEDRLRQDKMRQMDQALQAREKQADSMARIREEEEKRIREEVEQRIRKEYEEKLKREEDRMKKEREDLQRSRVRQWLESNPLWREFCVKLGVTEEELQDPEVVRKVMETVQQFLVSQTASSAATAPVPILPAPAPGHGDGPPPPPSMPQSGTMTVPTAPQAKTSRSAVPKRAPLSSSDFAAQLAEFKFKPQEQRKQITPKDFSEGDEVNLTNLLASQLSAFRSKLRVDAADDETGEQEEWE